MRRLTQGLALVALAMMLLWHVVPIQQERKWISGPATGSWALGPQHEWIEQAGWTLWPQLWELLWEAPSMSLADADTWQALVFTSCFLAGAVGVAAMAGVLWFGVPRLLRVGMSVLMTFALAGGPGLLAFLWFTEPPDPDHYRFYPAFLLWPGAVVLSWLASVLWAALRGKEG
jgi:hypothetical protein